jgi:hypothetical protein
VTIGVHLRLRENFGGNTILGANFNLELFYYWDQIKNSVDIMNRERYFSIMTKVWAFVYAK